MNSGNGNNFNVAPHGIVAFALFALLVIVALHVLGFSVVGAVKVGS